MKKMKGFIASAFGRSDVDFVYDKCILPTLQKLSIHPSRVDRVEHNDDIDDRIIQLINDADFAIAELTYARPSVYFEAGYAQGLGKPVIYIARNDHFRARDDDLEGLLRVHFDLQMKNIIAWSKPNDVFSKRLEKRINYVLRPLLKKRKRDYKLKDERNEFQKMSNDLKLTALRTKARALLRSRAFSLPNPQVGRGIQSNALVGTREYRRKRQQIAVVFTPSALKGLFEAISMIGAFGGFGGNIKLPLQFHYIISSLRSVPKSRITQTLSHYNPLENGVMHYAKKETNWRKKEDVFVHVISGIQSTVEFADAFRDIFSRFDLEKV